MYGTVLHLLGLAGVSVVEPEPVKKLRVRAVAVWLRGTGTVVAK